MEQALLPNQIIKLNIGGVRYETTAQTLTRNGDNYFTSLLSKRIPPTLDSDGCYFIDRDGAYFAPILEYLRTNELNVPDSINQAVYREAKYYSIDLPKFAKKEKRLKFDRMYEIEGRYYLFFDNGDGITLEDKFTWKKTGALVSISVLNERAKKLLLIDGKCPPSYKFRVRPLHTYKGEISLTWEDEYIFIKGEMVQLIFDDEFVYCILDNGMVATQYTIKQLEHYEVYSFLIAGNAHGINQNNRKGVGPTKPVEVTVIPLDSKLFVKTGKETNMFTLV